MNTETIPLTQDQGAGASAKAEQALVNDAPAGHRPTGFDPSRWPWPKNCGPCCRGYEPISGTCSHHWTAADRIVERVTSEFRRDLQAIIRSDK